MPLTTIHISPDDKELTDAINLVEVKKRVYERADKNWNRVEPSAHIYGHQYDAFANSRKAYESALINLALIVMARIKSE